MSGLIDLCDNVTPETMRRFVVAVTGLACQDFEQGRKKYGRTGREICGLTTDKARRLHHKMASGIYNNTIWTLELSKEAEDEASHSS